VDPCTSALALGWAKSGELEASCSTAEEALRIGSGVASFCPTCQLTRWRPRCWRPTATNGPPPKTRVNCQELTAWLEGYAGRSEADRERLATRISQVKRDRYRWAEKAMQGTVPDDIAQQKQHELGQQLLWAEAELHKLGIKEDDLRRLVEVALRLAENCSARYQASPPDVRRLWNQAWWEAIELDIVGGEPTIVKLHRTSVAGAVRRDAHLVRRWRKWGREGQHPLRDEKTDASGGGVGSNFDLLVAATGRPSKKSTGSTLELPVGVRGLEPLTSRV